MSSAVLLAVSSPIPLRHAGSFHALFGALLLIFVAASFCRFCRQVRQTPRMPPADIHAFSRHLSRTVYLLLYVLMFLDHYLKGRTLRALAEAARRPGLTRLIAAP